MVDVTMHECFPTVISEFSFHPSWLSQKQMVEYIKLAKKNNNQHTDDTLHKMSYYSDLRNTILGANKNHLKKLDYKYDNLEITGMWANFLFVGDSHAPHTHSNNFLSGVYYLEAGQNTSNIQFFDPRPQASVLQPRNNPNKMNSSMMEFNSTKGFGYIFPSWLQHWVPTTKEERISISWNIILRGEYGESGTLQNARI